MYIKYFLLVVYMECYNCHYCNYETTNKSNYNKHLETLKHKKMELKPRKNHEKPRMDDYNCKYCDKTFKHKNSMYHHIKYTCKKNKDEDLKELVRLMNLQLQKKDREIEYQKIQNNNQQKQINKLMGKLQVNITNNIIQTNHIQLLSYKNTDTSHLTEKDYVQCIKKVSYCVKDLIEKIHFNPIKPENMNIYISNMKDKYIMVYEDGNWNLKNKNIEIDELYNEKEILLEDWLDEYQHKYPELRQKFEKYLNNKENDETMNKIKEEIKLLMYNQKNKNG